MIEPHMDGIDHINIYSKGKTKLGRFLSNFAYSPIETEDGRFTSVEGYWYWLMCKHQHQDKDRLRKLSGFAAKKFGRELVCKDWIDDATFKNKIRRAIGIKIKNMRRDLFTDFVLSPLPFKHYYVYGGKVVEVEQGEWIIDHIETIRRKYKREAARSIQG